MQGRQSGIMVQDKRETPDKDLSGKKKNSQKLIYSSKSLHTNNEIWEGTGQNALKHLHDLAMFILETDQF